MQVLIVSVMVTVSITVSEIKNTGIKYIACMTDSKYKTVSIPCVVLEAVMCPSMWSGSLGSPHILKIHTELQQNRIAHVKKVLLVVLPHKEASLFEGLINTAFTRFWKHPGWYRQCIIQVVIGYSNLRKQVCSQKYTF